MRVWLQNPFDNLPEEGYRKQRYRLMADAFVRAGHSVVDWTSDFSHSGKTARKLVRGVPPEIELRLVPTPAYRGNVSLRRVWSHLVYAVRWYRAAKALATRNGEVPDLLVASLPTVSGALAAVLLGRKLGVKTVVDVQDAWPETFYRLAPRGFGPLVRLALLPVRLAARWVYRNADLVTGVCDRYRALVGRGDYYRAYLGVELEGRKAREERKVPGKRLVYAGAMGRSYDLGRWVRQVERDESLTLDVASTGRLATSCPRIRQHGYLPAEKLRGLLESCDVGIIPMSDDSWVGIPNKFFDYAAAGLRIETSLGGECAALADRWNRGELPLDELDAVKIYDGYARRFLV